MIRLLLTRFSALGDVAMTAPVVKAFAMANPDVRFVMVSRPFAKSFYDGLAENVEFVGMDLKAERYKGMFGIEHVYQDLRALRPDVVADLHDVLRTKYARLRFRMAGIPVYTIDKNRKAQKALVSQENKCRTQLKTSFEKYADVIGNALKAVGKNADVKLDASTKVLDFSDKTPLFTGEAIGIAPFAAHEGKIYPIDKMEQVIAILEERHPQMKVILFGGGKKELAVFDRWKSAHTNTMYAGDICKGMVDELRLMSTLRCMISMDSGNMHLASLTGTKVVSIWGATHPLAGFMGWGQSDSNAIQVDLPCRPCSIYGNKPCQRGDYACLNSITPEKIIESLPLAPSQRGGI